MMFHVEHERKPATMAKRQQVMISLSPGTATTLARIADLTGLTRSAIIEASVREYSVAHRYSVQTHKPAVSDPTETNETLTTDERQQRMMELGKKGITNEGLNVEELL